MAELKETTEEAERLRIFRTVISMLLKQTLNNQINTFYHFFGKKENG